MYKWNIDILLKGANSYKRCVYIGPEKQGTDVAMKVFNYKPDRYFVDLYGDDEKTLTYVRMSEITAFDICERKG